jgi:hypothetical protein
MTTTIRIRISDPIVRYELTAHGVVVVELSADGKDLSIRLAFGRGRFDSSTALGGGASAPPKRERPSAGSAATPMTARSPSSGAGKGP